MNTSLLYKECFQVGLQLFQMMESLIQQLYLRSGMLTKQRSLYLFSFSIKLKNISQNPFAFATITNPASFDTYTLELKYNRTESEGDLFDEMDMKLEAIASMSGMSGIFELKGADIYTVLSISKNNL